MASDSGGRLEAAVATPKKEQRLPVTHVRLLDLPDAEHVIPRVMNSDDPAVEIDEGVSNQGSAGGRLEGFDTFEPFELVLLGCKFVRK